ncbi:MAG: hypothetical protein ACXVDA_06145 [Ktedonobacterales bacterium]
MADEWSGEAPVLREETRTARGRTLELLVTVVVLSTLLSFSVNIGSSLLLQVLTQRQELIVAGASGGLAILAALLLVPRISTTIKEFHEEIEICLPLLVSAQDVEVLRIAYYDELTEMAHAALARRPAEERRRMAEVLQHPASDRDVKLRREIAAFALELAQFLFTVEVVQASRQLLGREAAYHAYRDVARMQPRVIVDDWQKLIAAISPNPYAYQQTAGVPEKLALPAGVRLYLPEIGRQLETMRRPRQRWSTGPEDALLLRVDGGRDAQIDITALADFSEHAYPQPTTPQRGALARCFLRNARDQRIRDLTREEQAAADMLDDQGKAKPSAADGEGALERYTSLHTRLYKGGQRPRLLRIYVRLDGTMRIRLLSGERRLRGLYVWGVALTRMLAQVDVDTFLAALRNAGQSTPRRQS